MTIATQIRDLGSGAEDLAECVSSLSDELFLEKINGWSARDIVAHLVGWNRAVIEGSRQIMRGNLPSYDIDSGENYSKVNAAFVREYSSPLKGPLLAELRRSARELQEFLRSLDPGAWARDYGVENQGATVTLRSTVEELIEDYTHHRQQIEEWRRKVGARPVR
jgi:hypothetical protein